MCRLKQTNGPRKKNAKFCFLLKVLLDDSLMSSGMREFIIIGQMWTQNSRSRQTTESFDGAQNSIYCQRDQFSTACSLADINSQFLDLFDFTSSFFVGSTWQKESV
jgi:hypothetical protein